MAAKSGSQIMIETVVGMIMKSLNLDPNIVSAHIQDGMGKVQSFDARLARIEDNQALILKNQGAILVALGIDEEVNDDERPDDGGELEDERGARRCTLGLGEQHAQAS